MWETAPPQMPEIAFPQMSEAAFPQMSETAFPQMSETAFPQMSEAAFPQEFQYSSLGRVTRSQSAEACRWQIPVADAHVPKYRRPFPRTTDQKSGFRHMREEQGEPLARDFFSAAALRPPNFLYVRPPRSDVRSQLQENLFLPK
jgi:hypothetical protein